ncbi:MAG: thioredoxin [Tannerella sp.]|jgi:thioredoxin 1|nr:thioredoxin [Tannerella sp.]
MALVVTDKNYKELLNGNKPVVLDFWAEWCGPCRMVGPVIDELATEYEGRVVMGKVDIDDNYDLVSEYGIRSVPTILFFKGGQIVDKQVGATGKDAFVEKINKLL